MGVKNTAGHPASYDVRPDHHLHIHMNLCTIDRSVDMPAIRFMWFWTESYRIADDECLLCPFGAKA
jgi:hypothetical protein